ncbi:hypothetical protein P7H41_05410 [Vagococcus fluvialis]|uniref:hypothetical protein n=1 Tax=Vagococcus fluvialis TaxID=2738 RepID=UPI0028909424|nr:hypothetical protein [Vagococcus fluvialis]MDT2781396.1 hypothetical protein [Vagococcus fluvialis]
MNLEEVTVFEDYPESKRERMLNILNSLVSDIDFDTDMGTIDSVLNGIEYNRLSKFKNIDMFQNNYKCSDLDEFEVSEVIGAAIGIAYFEKFCT